MPNDKSVRKDLQVIKIFNTLFPGHAMNPEEITPSFWADTDLQNYTDRGHFTNREWHHLVAHLYVTLRICMLFKDFLIQELAHTT